MKLLKMNLIITEMDTFPIELEILGKVHTISVPFKQGFDNLRKEQNDAIYFNAYLDLTDHILSNRLILQDFQIAVLKAKLMKLMGRLYEKV
jgi:hypothetical protein